MTETTRHKEILVMYRAASADTRLIHDASYNYSGTNEENWVVR